MQPEFWHERWRHNEIGFHQGSINQYLQDHWSKLGLSGGETVLVPLCGKSLDMHWIHEKGHPVIGVEINEIACQQFFAEANLEPHICSHEPFIQYRLGGLMLLCGDFFALTAKDVPDTAVAYDRAALIALPADMRRKYVLHLHKILAPAAQVLLVTMEYTRDGGTRAHHPSDSVLARAQTDAEGPPFSVPEAEVRALCGGYFDLQPIYQQELGRDDPFAKRKGFSDMWEKVYVLKRCG